MRRATAGYRAVVAVLQAQLARPLTSYYLLITSAAVLVLFGLTMVFSATSVEQFASSGSAFTSIQKQIMSAVVGLGFFWLAQRLPVRTYRALARPGIIAAIVFMSALDILALLAQVGILEHAIFGPIRADKLWLYIGPLQVQPSEFAKLALVIWTADVLARKGTRAGIWRELAQPLLAVAALLFVLVGYNDLGTMLCLVALFIGILWAAGVRLSVFAGMLAVAVTGVIALIFVPGNTYRLARLIGFLHPDQNQSDASYQVRQGLAAIGNGGWFGVGLGEGRLKWGWLPNGHNDFIFAVIAEELGVVGCLVVIGLFCVLAYAGLRIARSVSNPFRRLAAAGVTALIAGQATINIAGVLELIPVTGLPLPLISDGGSALVVTLTMIGMMASFARAEPAAAQAILARPPGRMARLLWAPLPPRPAPRPGTATGVSTGEGRGHDDG